ncbi:uncharacterized protein METZ01_LOCUS460148, partial [marine metagenome]
VKPTLIALLALGSCICLYGCESVKLPLKNANKKQLKLAADAHQVLQKHCRQCHGKGDSQSDEMLLEYEALIEDKFVRPWDTQRSKLYRVIAKGDMPREEKDAPAGLFPRYDIGGPAVPEEELELIKQWINAGAPNWEKAGK